jgi:hypothetical protein
MHTDRAAVGALADDATDRLRHWLNVRQRTVTAPSVAGGGGLTRGAFGWINHTYEHRNRPHYFHQSNLITGDDENASVLMYVLLDAALER